MVDYVTSHTSVRHSTMSSQTAHDPSILELLRVLNDKLGLGCIGVRETPLPPVVSTTSLETNVSISRSIRLNERGGWVLQ